MFSVYMGFSYIFAGFATAYLASWLRYLARPSYEDLNYEDTTVAIAIATLIGWPLTLILIVLYYTVSGAFYAVEFLFPLARRLFVESMK